MTTLSHPGTTFEGRERGFPPPAKASGPLRAECLDYVMDLEPGFRHGMWGGTTPAERDEIAERGKAMPS